MAEKFTEKTVLGDLLNDPEASKILAKYKLPCLHCAMAAFEMGMLTIGDASRTYGIDLEGLLSELNEMGN
jgi:hypothetical protein